LFLGSIQKQPFFISTTSQGYL